MRRVSVVEARPPATRGLKQARTPHGYYLARRGQRKFPPWRRPFQSFRFTTTAAAPYFHVAFTSHSQHAFLPQENYVTGEWTGLFNVGREQVYTLQHATSGATVRVRRFPSYFTFDAPSRWIIGRTLRTLAKPRTAIVDEQMLTKKQRLDYIKAGLLPK